MNNQAGTGTSTDGCEMNWQSLSTDDTVAFSNKPTDKHCDTTNWSEFLYSKFDPASTQLDDSDIEEDVYSLEEEAEKISGLPLESLTANELHKKNELIKFECKANELTDWDTVEVDLNEQDCKNVVATGKNEKLVLECNPEEKTPESQCIRDTASVDTSDKDEVNHEKNLSESHSEIETTQTSSGRKQIREKRIYPLYSCDHCDKTFIDSARLACHRLKAHGIEDKDTSMIRRSKRTANRKIPDVREFEKLQIEPMQQQAAEIALVESLVTDEIHIKDELIEFDCNDHELADATVEVADENNQSLETNVQESTPESQSLRGTVSADTCDKDAILTVQLFPKKKSSESQSETEEKSSTKNKPVVKKTMKYYCEHCDEVFIRWPRLLYHRARVHGIEDKDVGVLRCQCELCGKVCFSKDALARHRSTHKNAKKADFKFPCSYCDRKFSMDYNRVHHEQTHTKIYDHICRICDKGFISRMRLLFHDVQKHNRNIGEHSFPSCSVCGKLFANQSQLAVHEETHINNRVLTCELCVKSFKTMQTLKSHVSICQMSKLRKSKRKERREERRKEMMEKMKERRKERKKSMGKVNDSEKPANSCKTDAGKMVKNYKTMDTGPHKKTDPRALQQAIEEVANKNMSCRAAARQYGINYSVLYKNSKKAIKPQGGETC